jgi:predicted N-acyltransferase
MQVEISHRSVIATVQNAAVRVSIYDTINAVPESDWLRFIPDGNPLLKPQYLKLLEDTQRGEMEFIYALVHKDDRLIGVCYFQIVRFRGTNLLPFFPTITSTSLSERLKAYFINLSKSFVAKLDLPLLVSGNLFITGEQGLYFLSNITELEKSFYLAHTIEHILKERKNIRTALLPDMYEPSGDFDTAFLKKNYQRIYVEADMSMILPNDWHSFEDYLQAISSKYRVRAKKIMQNSQALTMHEMTADDIEANIDRFYYLYRIVADKADFNIAKFPKDYFVAQKRLSPDLYKIFGYYLDGVLVGFMSIFILPNKTEVHYCGIDYSINKDYALYQRMLYDTGKYAIENNLRKLHFGRTAPEVKSAIGAIPHPMYGYIRYKNPILNSLMGLFTSRLKPREYIHRNPFK